MRGPQAGGGDTDVALLAIDLFCGAVFAIEVVLRCACLPTCRLLATDALLWLDALLMVPIVARAALAAGAAPAPDAWQGFFACVDAIGPLRLLKMARYVLGVPLSRAARAALAS